MAARAPAQESAVGRRLAEVRRCIGRAAERADRDPEEVTLVAVTKTVDASRIRELLDAGVSHLGENRLQDAIEKMRLLADRAPTWHFIGHLQTNKARKAAELFDRIESVDSLKLAEKLESAAEEIGRELRVFVEANVGGEASKHGVALDELPSFVAAVNALPRVEVTGLMAVPPRRGKPEESRPDFRRLAVAFGELRARWPAMRHLSMGMSADFEVAIEEGATEIRVGTALFGPRRA